MTVRKRSEFYALPLDDHLTLAPCRAFSRAASRTHGDTVKPASPATCRSSSFSASVTRTLTRVCRRSSAAIGCIVHAITEFGIEGDFTKPAPILPQKGQMTLALV